MQDQSAVLTDFVRTAKEKGVSDGAIVALLRQQGWQERALYRALSEWYAQMLGIPVPTRGSRAEFARDAFLYLMSFVTLGAWVFALIHLGDALVDRSFSIDTYLGSLDFRQNVAGYLATIIIAFPIHIWVGTILAREIKRRPESLESGVRKWLTYLALVVTASVLIGDAVWFLSDFLKGELTTAFTVKTGVLVLLTGGVFTYYLGSVRRDDHSVTRDRIFAMAATVAVVLGLAAGFGPIGTPSHQLSVSRDEQRLQNIGGIADAFHSEYASNPSGYALPENLADDTLIAPSSDPLTNLPSEYHRIDARYYRLCANFETSDAMTASPFWHHGTGETCYRLDSRKEYQRVLF
jgi:Domain of unknown function (DUF5671)